MSTKAAKTRDKYAQGAKSVCRAKLRVNAPVSYLGAFRGPFGDGTP